MWNKDEIRGKGKQIKGAIKDKIGEAIRNPRLEAQGEAERRAGIVQEKLGTGRRQIGKVVARVRKVISGKR